jgi:hypothetical protein
MRLALMLCVLAGAACGKKEESKVTPAAAGTVGVSEAGRAAAPAGVVVDAGAAVAGTSVPVEEVESLNMASMEAVESMAAHCEGARCDPKRTEQAKLAAPAPPFLAASILDSAKGAMEDTGYVFVQTAKGWFVAEFLWSLEEGELRHRVRRIEVTDYVPGGAPELVIAMEKSFLDSEKGPVMHRKQEVLVVCAVAIGGAPACVDPEEPIVLSSRAEDATWRVEVTPRPDGILERKAVEGTPPAEVIGPVRIATP